MNATVNRYTIALLSVMMVCLLAVPATANYAANGWTPTTRTDGTINGTVFIDSVAWNGQTTRTLSTAVPNGTVKWAYLYTGVWGGNNGAAGWHNVTFNGNHTANGLGPIHLRGTADTNSNVWCTGSGKYWWWYNVTNLTNAGQTNTAVTSKINGSLDGRVYGTVLVVVLEDDNLSTIRYWINDGSDALQSGHNSGTTYFNGNVDTDNVTTSALTVVHLTGYSPGCNNALDFNDHPLDTSMVTSNTIEVNTWNNANSNVTPDNVTSSGNHADYRRCQDGYVNVCNAILVLNDSAIDLTVDDIDIGTPRPNTNFTVNATIRNWGTEDTGGHFNVSLHVDGVLNGTVNVTAGLSGGGSTTVSFEDVNLSKGCYEFKVFADCDRDVTESIETNNNLTVNGQVGYVIVVEKNSDFDVLVTASENGAFGDGNISKVGTTYYIQNFTGDYAIENCNGNGITIENTDATFVIRNCTIKDCTYSGVKFHNLSYGTIDNSTVTNNTVYGIEVGEVPLDGDDPNYVNITCNAINETRTDVLLIVYNATVVRNTILNNTEYAIYLYGNDSNITCNMMEGNTGYAIKAYNSSRNNIYCNTFIDNNAGNPGHQAWDNGNSNNWNSTELSKNYIGNLWNDWDDNSGYPSTYDIDGGGNKDKRPRGLYDFLTGKGVDKWAFKWQITPAQFNSGSPIYPNTEFNAAEYAAIKADDGVFACSTTTANGYHAAHRFNFSTNDSCACTCINESALEMSVVNVTWIGKGWHGSGAGYHGANLSIWNFTSSAYEELDSTTLGTEVTLTGAKTSSISSYISLSGNVTILVKQRSPQTSRPKRYSHICTDYVKVGIVAS